MIGRSRLSFERNGGGSFQGRTVQCPVSRFDELTVHVSTPVFCPASERGVDYCVRLPFHSMRWIDYSYYALPDANVGPIT